VKRNVPRKYNDVKSRVGEARPQTAANGARPPTGAKPPVPQGYARMPMAPLSKRPDYAFGGSYKQRPASTRSQQSSLTTQALANFDENPIKVVTYGQQDEIYAQKPTDPEIVANHDQNWKEDQSEVMVNKENSSAANNQHKNYGKTPKYLQ
jgi:hypothetical protein